MVACVRVLKVSLRTESGFKINRALCRIKGCCSSTEGRSAGTSSGNNPETGSQPDPDEIRNREYLMKDTSEEKSPKTHKQLSPNRASVWREGSMVSHR